MLETPLGNIALKIDGENVHYDYQELPTKGRNYSVDFCCQIHIRNIKGTREIVCEIVDEKSVGIEPFEDSGERLALISFYAGSEILSIGVEGDVEGIWYVYLPRGIRMEISSKCKKEDLRINIAWLAMTDPEVEDIYTTIAADPTEGEQA